MTRDTLTSTDKLDESWINALALAAPGQAYVVNVILSDFVRSRCIELGCPEGSELLCTESDHDGISFLTHDGFVRRLERVYAWFIRVESPQRQRSAVKQWERGHDPMVHRSVERPRSPCTARRAALQRNARPEWPFQEIRP